MTFEYDHQGLGALPDVSGDQHFLVRKWTHSILGEPDFLSEWSAIEKAASLALELGSSRSSDLFHAVRPLSESGAIGKNKHVKFCLFIEVCIGDEQPFIVPSHAFTCWPGKSWALVEDWNRQPPSIQKKRRTPCVPPSWHSMTGFLLPQPVEGVPMSLLRIMDEFVNLPRIPDEDGDTGLPAHVPLGHQPGQLPDFTDNMLAQMDPSLATPANFAQGAVVIRTWYIHHEWHRRNEFPRLVHLGGDRASWIQQILAAWSDTVDLTIPKAFTLPTPMPFRGQADQFVALDVIISQGLHHPRFSGLVSVHFLDELDGQGSFILAASFAAWVSGYHIVDAADVHQFCAPVAGRECNIFHGWDTIPVDPHSPCTGCDQGTLS